MTYTLYILCIWSILTLPFQYGRFLNINLLFTLLALVLAPILPAFATVREGYIDNAHAIGKEPRLPKWLSWFMTIDNSLWGDSGWQTKHHPTNYKSYWSQVLWLWRNSAYGFKWTVLAKEITQSTAFNVFPIVENQVAENGDIIWKALQVDKGQKRYGWFYISGPGMFQFRFALNFYGILIAGDYGWLLDSYVKQKDEYIKAPKALFQFAPKFPSKIKD